MVVVELPGILQLQGNVPNNFGQYSINRRLCS